MPDVFVFVCYLYCFGSMVEDVKRLLLMSVLLNIPTINLMLFVCSYNAKLICEAVYHHSFQELLINSYFH